MKIELPKKIKVEMDDGTIIDAKPCFFGQEDYVRICADFHGSEIILGDWHIDTIDRFLTGKTKSLSM